MNNPKVSIITPTYNSSLFIKRTVESVRAQTFTDWEYLIVDDHSTDNTTELIGEFIRQDPRIKLLQTSQNSGGPATPKNVGVERAVGQYIAFLDHDDEWLPEKLAKQLKAFEESKDEKLCIVSCGANLINDKGNCFSIYNPINEKVAIPEILLRNPIYSNSSVLMKSEVAYAVGKRDERMKYSEDWDMWIRVMSLGYNITFINEPLFNYYFHENNITKASKDKLIKVKDAEYVFQKHYDLYSKYNYVHVGYFRLGIMYFLGGDTKTSRSNFKKSIKTKKLFLPAYIGWALSFLDVVGVSIINFLIFLYRIFKGRTYLIKT